MENSEPFFRRRYVDNPFMQSSKENDVFESIEKLYKEVEIKSQNIGVKEGAQDRVRLRGTKKLVDRLYETETLADFQVDNDGNCKHTLDWTATLPVQVLYIEYLSRKYNLTCNMNLNRMYKNPNFYEIQSIGLYIHVYDDEQTFHQNKLRDQSINKKLAEDFSECIGNETVDPMKVYPYYVRLMFHDNKDKIYKSHANILLVRPNLGIIEYFEPHGLHFNQGYHKQYKTTIKQINDAVRYFAEQFNLHGSTLGRKSYTLILPHLTCPQLDGIFKGVQNLEARAGDKTCHEKDRGYCAAWSFFVLELVLMNPKRTLRDTQESVLEHMQTKYTDEKDFSQSYQTIETILRTIIRSYIRHIYKSLATFVSVIYDKTFATERELSDFIKGTNKKPYYSTFLVYFSLYLKFMKIIEDEAIQSPNEFQQKIDEMNFENGPTTIDDSTYSQEEIEQNKRLVDKVVQNIKTYDLLWLPNKRKGEGSEKKLFSNSFDMALNNNGNKPTLLLPNKTTSSVDLLREELDTTEKLLEEETDVTDKLKEDIANKDKEIAKMKKENANKDKEIENLKKLVKNLQKKNKTMKLKLNRQKNINLRLSSKPKLRLSSKPKSNVRGTLKASY